MLFSRYYQCPVNTMSNAYHANEMLHCTGYRMQNNEEEYQ